MGVYRTLPLWCNVGWTPPKRKIANRGYSDARAARSHKKLSDEQVREILRSPKTYAELAKEYAVSKHHIRMIKDFGIRSHVR